MEWLDCIPTLSPLGITQLDADLEQFEVTWL